MLILVDESTLILIEVKAVQFIFDMVLITILKRVKYAN